MKSVLEEKGLMDTALYKELRIRRMVADHGGGGASPWRNTSSIPTRWKKRTLCAKNWAPLTPRSISLKKTLTARRR
jgi:hypothetical protein